MRTHFKVYLAVLFFSLGFLALQPGQAQTADDNSTVAAPASVQLSGQVVDTNSGQPLSGATVAAGDNKTQTDAKGHFSLSVDGSVDSVTIDEGGYGSVVLSTHGWGGEKVVALKPSSMTLPEVLVQSYDTNDSLLQTAGATGILTEEDLDRGNKINSAPILQTVAGVQVDQSDMEDSRISIRGEGLRSTYGIRDIALFIDGIPLNEADNFGRIEGLDLYNIGNAEIIKGPDSSLYGAGTGGAINFSSVKPNPGETSLSTDDLIGSYGLDRESGTLKADLGNGGIVLSYANQDFAGWEAHTGDYKTFATGTGTFHPSDKDTLTVFLNQSDEQAYFNQAENFAQFTNNPAGGGTNSSSYSLYNIHRYEFWTRTGVTNTYEISDQWENKTSVFSASYTLDHPYGYGYADSYLVEDMQEFGGRSELTFRPTSGDVATRVTGGADLANEYTLADYYTNSVPGAATYGALNSIDNDYERHVNLFLEAELTLEKATVFTAGFNYNNTQYAVNNSYSNSSTVIGASGATAGIGPVTATFSPATSFRAAVNHSFDDQYSVYADVAQGYSPPGIAEDTNNANGGLLQDLNPQTSTQYEVGTRGYLFDKRLNFDLALYEADLDQELIPYTTYVSAYYSYTNYINAGSTTHQGAELALSYILLDPTDGFFKLVKPWVTYAYQNYQFGSGNIDQNNGTNYQGKYLPGNAVNNLNIGLDVDTKPGLYANANYLWKDGIPLDNGNTVWDGAYGLFAAKIGFKHQIGQFKFDLYGGAYNLFNVSYNAYPELNVTGQYGGAPAYYEPGLPQNFYGGTTLSYLF